MSEQTERYHRLLRAPPEDTNVLEIPDKLRTFAEELGHDPRRPKTAIARMVSRLWHRTRIDNQGDDSPALNLNITDKEYLVRPAYYPVDFGIGFVPHPNEIGATTANDNRLLSIVAYTSLSVPRPFDPHFHGTHFGSGVVTTQPGFGFNYLGGNPWPGKNDIVQRMGGGPRGGFAYTTGPTEGNYPTGVMPQTTFNLGQLGYSNGGWYPEGVSYTNRPRNLRLNGLRNGWNHRVYFARSRKVMFRNLYGPIGTDFATPKCPNVVLNGSRPLKGVKDIQLNKKLNTPSKCRITISSHHGERAGKFRQFDTVQVYMAPQNWSEPPLVFTGFVNGISETNDTVVLDCYDTLKYLEYEVLTEEPNFPDEDAASTIRAIIGASTYAIPVYDILASARMFLPTSIKLKGKTRLSAVQLIMQTINSSQRQMRLYSNERGILQLDVFPDTETDNAPVIGGNWPRTDKPTDIIVTNIKEMSGQSTQFNVAIVANEDGTIEGQYPKVGATNYPGTPVMRRFIEKALTNAQDAEMLSRQYVNAQYDNDRVWTVDAIPNRFDITPGDAGSFESMVAGLSGKYRIFDVTYKLDVRIITTTLQIGKPRRSLSSALKYSINN